MTVPGDPALDVPEPALAAAGPSPRLDAAGRVERLDEALAGAREALLALQREDGHWCFELEADCTIPAEYVLMMHFMAELDEALQAKLAAYLRARQAEHGGWPLYLGGQLDLSCTVKAYYALKLAGDDPEAPHMVRAREAVLARGGAARANVFTRIALATFGQVPWRAVPFVAVEMILLPRWFFFHLRKVSYWTRTVTVPLSILCSLKARAKNPSGLGVRELFTVPPEEERDYFVVRSPLNRVFLTLERTARLFEPLIPGFVRRRALKRATEWFTERLNGEDGLGAIFPAMVNAYESLALLGYAEDHPLRATAKRAIRKLVVEHESWAYCQPCVSPVWDTGLCMLALQDTRAVAPDEALDRALGSAARWLEARQVLDGPADWRREHPEVEPGGWAFQYANPYYPDLDDTAVVAWALWQEHGGRETEAVRRATNWLRGLQSKGGGFAAFDADNTWYSLNEIPFADHGALLDPPTADVSARVVTLYGLLGREADRESLERCLEYLFDEQESDGAWFGRWGTNYVYGTWSVLTALEQVEHPRKAAAVERAVAWLEAVQRPDGSWGEDNGSYFDRSLAGKAERGTAFQTAWAVLALVAAGQGRGEAARRGVDHLLAARGADGLWEDPEFTAPGFPRVFYLRYHGYSRFFPLWALARYRALQAAAE